MLAERLWDGSVREYAPNLRTKTSRKHRNNANGVIAPQFLCFGCVERRLIYDRVLSKVLVPEVDTSSNSGQNDGCESAKSKEASSTSKESSKDCTRRKRSETTINCCREG